VIYLTIALVVIMVYFFNRKTPPARVKPSHTEVIGKKKWVDAKTLVVGQDVCMLSAGDTYINKGKVIVVTPSGVDVETSEGELYHFDEDGNEPDVNRSERLGFGPSSGDRFHTVLWCAAPEFQPWHLDNIPWERGAHMDTRPRKEVSTISIEQLPEQIQTYYREHPTAGRTNPHIRQEETRILVFFDLLPEEKALPRGDSYLHIWEKHGDSWVLTDFGLVCG
jgi:hypothetical protein